MAWAAQKTRCKVCCKKRSRKAFYPMPAHLLSRQSGSSQRKQRAVFRPALLSQPP